MIYVLEFLSSEAFAYIGMLCILLAFFLETRHVLDSKQGTYLMLMAVGSGILALRAYFIQEWAFFILEVAWFATAVVGLAMISKSFNQPPR
ncbi:MAG: hypothetical protein CMA63_02230 [Euryarchaeota archaeon]|nr:hypothetical protein [Euryarchaeota archaeon]